MIDSHCHLCQPEYSKDLDEVIKKCKKIGLKAIITSCVHPKYFQRTMKIVEKYKGFVFASAAIHPEYIKELSEKEIDDYINVLRENKDKLVAIGEQGLDFHWIKEPEQIERQKQMFIKLLRLAKELDKPVVIHSREALEETLNILEKEGMKHVLLHMWGGHALMDTVNHLGYYVSMNSIIMSSKSYRKVIKKVPAECLMLETDAPWLAIKKSEDGYKLDPKARNDSTTIKLVAEKIAELNNIPFETVWKQCGDNSIRFFNLNFK